ncbi:putative lipoprotein YgeR [Nymphon striatum]|nr:putative lipoprotein YgeR [Nymphon striatum]
MGVALAGCASGTARFSDGFYTGAIPKRDVGAVQTPFPQAAPQQVYQQPTYQSQPVYAPQANAPAAVDRTYTGSVSRQPLAAPTAPALPAAPAVVAPVANAVSAAVPAAAPVIQAVKAPIPSFKPAAAVATSTAKAGWSAIGGSYVTARAGDSINALSKRYGVPAKEIAKANGLSAGSALSNGAKIIIPTYSSGAKAASSAVTKAKNAVSTAKAISNAPIPHLASLRRTQVASLAPAIVAAPKVAKAAIKSGKYVVSSGDTLSRISSLTGASITSIKRLNGMSSDNLKIGQSVLIPGIAGNPTATQLAAAAPKIDPVKTSATAKVAKKVASYTPPKPKISNKGSISTIDSSSTASAPAETGVSAMRWPTQGRVVSAFGSNVGGKGNDGIDISVPKGTPIKAAENGVVIYAGDGLKELGKTVTSASW